MYNMPSCTLLTALVVSARCSVLDLTCFIKLGRDETMEFQSLHTKRHLKQVREGREGREGGREGGREVRSEGHNERKKGGGLGGLLAKRRNS